MIAELGKNTLRRQCGHAIAETVVALAAFLPLLIGLPLLGKQLDVKQKTYEAARYDVWERTVWHSEGAVNEKSTDDIAVEAQDRIMGNPHAGLVRLTELRSTGVTESYMWRNRANQSLLNYIDNARPIVSNEDSKESPVDVGGSLTKSAAYGTGVFSIMKFAGWRSLGLAKDGFITAGVTTALRPELQVLAAQGVTVGKPVQASTAPEPLTQEARGAILSDTWSPRDEAEFRMRAGNLTVNEAVWTVETPGMALGVLGSKGKALTGEAQFGWGAGGLSKGPDLTTPSTVLPPKYQHENR